MRVIMSGGGTGGHIYPAIAIADKIKEKQPGAEILFVGTEKGLESTLVPQNGYPIRFVKASGFNRKKPLKNFRVMADLYSGVRAARKIVKEFRPDIVIGTGGYVCWPVLKAASETSARVFIHEQNASPGLSNKMLEKYAEKVFIGFSEAGAGFKRQDKIVFSGNPVRKSFYGLRKDEARAKLGISAGDFVIVAFGGSRGAVKINEVMTEVSAVFSGAPGVTVFLATGEGHYDEALKKFKEEMIGAGGNIHVLPYLLEMELYIAAGDLVISRAGALTVAELWACGKPAILIPSPNVTGNHQFFNAKALSDKGGAVLIEEKDLSLERLAGLILKMKGDGSILAKMAAATEGEKERDAAGVIYDNIFTGGEWADVRDSK